MSETYYDILNLDDSCDLKQIKSSYRKLAKKYHPDKNLGNQDIEEKFKKVTKAYEVLKDNDKRSEYDKTLKVKGFSNFEEMHNMFGGFWNDHFDQDIPEKGEDVNVISRLTLEEFDKGCIKVIRLAQEKLRITIKPGTLPYSKLKITGKGDLSLNGGEPGDVIVSLNPLKHEKFELLENNVDVQLKLSLSYPTLILGAKIKIETVKGFINISIPPNTKVGSSLKLKHQGIGENDLFVKIDLYMPITLNRTEKELIKKLSDCPNISPFIKRS